MSNIDKQALTDEEISKAFAGTNFGRDDFKNILAETVIDAAAGWRCGYTATTIWTQLGLLAPKGCASELGLRFISELVQRDTKRLKDELEAKDKRIDEQREIMRQAASDISYAIFNLTGSDLSRLNPGVVETTGPTDTALIAERNLRAAAAGKGE